MSDVSQLLRGLRQGDHTSLARVLTLVENELNGGEELLEQLVFTNPCPLIGITGPPGAGKSTLLNVLTRKFIQQNKKVGIIAVDPSSPFHSGALLGDRIRLNEHYNHPDVFIRSTASRGNLGGLSKKIIELSDVMRAAAFDYIFIETVGVGQSEVEIAGLADVTIVILVPESGDEVQTMKAGLMEVADIFVVNKCDHTHADLFVAYLNELSGSKTSKKNIQVIKTTATTGEGVDLLLQVIQQLCVAPRQDEKKIYFLVEKIRKVIPKEKMKLINQESLLEEVRSSIRQPGFNLYRIAKKYS